MKKGNKVIDEEGNYAATNGNEKLGSIYPDFTGGWTNTFKYKNLDLSVLLDFSKGRQIFLYFLYVGYVLWYARRICCQ